MIDPITALTATAKAVGITQKVSRVARGMTQTAKADAAFEEEIEDLVLTLASSGEYRTPPTSEQVRAAARQLGEAAKRATNDAKVRMLEAAFSGMLAPRFYEEGWNQILWDIVVKLEAPDAVYLREVIAGEAAARATNRAIRDGVGVQRRSADLHLARRLIEAGLLRIVEDNLHAPSMIVASTGICERVREFLWGWPGTMPASERADELCDVPTGAEQPPPG